MHKLIDFLTCSNIAPVLDTLKVLIYCYLVTPLSRGIKELVDFILNIIFIPLKLFPQNFTFFDLNQGN